MPVKNELDLMLINPGSRHEIYQALGVRLSAIEPPIWAGLIASYIREKGHAVEILDANARGLGPKQVAEAVAQASPMVTAIVVYGHNPSASTQVMPAAGAICRAINTADLPTRTILVGGHVAALPERTLREEAVDFVCSGEGPVTIDRLLAHLKKGSDALEEIPGLVFRRADTIIMNAPAAYVDDLDREMPGMAWDLLDMGNYRSHNWQCFGRLDERQPYAALYTSLGCPFDCAFCCIQTPFKNSVQASGRKMRSTYRMWGRDTVLQQIDFLVAHHDVKTFKFADEMFVLNNRHVHGICEALIERDYDLNIWAYARVDTVSDRLLAKLRRAGFQWLCLGIESGNQDVLDSVNKGYDVRTVKKTIQTIHDAGIHVIANYLFGLPEDDRSRMQQTLDLACELNTAFANFYCAMAYPGSRLYDDAVAADWPLPDSWMGFSQHAYDALPLPTRYLSGPEVLEFRDNAFHHYFDRPDYRRHILHAFGQDTLDHIDTMTAHRLERKHVPPPTKGSSDGR